jgi:autoinducer 2-degrading protein
MTAACVNVYVKEEYIEEFKAASLKNHQQSVKEKGNLRFDILQHTEDKCRFMLYEAYESKEYAAAHKETPHYQEWKNTVEKMMAVKREGIIFDILAPESSEKC